MTSPASSAGLAELCCRSPSAWQRHGLVWWCRSLPVFRTELCHHFCCLPRLSCKGKRLPSEISGARCSLKLPFADPTPKVRNVAAFRTMSEEEKLSAGLKPLLAKDKRQSLSLILAHTHTDKQEEKLSGAQSITVLISSGLSEIVTGTGPAGV